MSHVQMPAIGVEPQKREAIPLLVLTASCQF